MASAAKFAFSGKPACLLPSMDADLGRGCDLSLQGHSQAPEVSNS